MQDESSAGENSFDARGKQALRVRGHIPTFRVVAVALFQENRAGGVNEDTAEGVFAPAARFAGDFKRSTQERLVRKGREHGITHAAVPEALPPPGHGTNIADAMVGGKSRS